MRSFGQKKRRKKHTHTSIAQKRTHHIKRPLDPVVVTKERKKNACTQQQHMNAYNIANGHWLRLLGQKKTKNTHTRTRTQQQHRNAYTMANDHRRRPLKEKKHTHNNNTESHTTYQTTTGCGRWDKQNIKDTHTHTRKNNTYMHTQYQTTAGGGH